MPNTRRFLVVRRSEWGSTATPYNIATDPQLGCPDFNQGGFGTVYDATGNLLSQGLPYAAITYNSPNNSLNTEQFYAVRIDQNIG